MYKEWTEGNQQDTIEAISMVSYIAHTLFGTLDSMSEGNWQLRTCSIICPSAWSWLVIRMLFVKWVIVNFTLNLSELSGLKRRYCKRFQVY